MTIRNKYKSNSLKMKMVDQLNNKIFPKRLTLTSLLIIAAFQSYSQSNSATIINTEIAPATVTDISVIDSASILKKIAIIDDHINAINIKTQHINSNPEEKIQAENAGWFTQMEKIKGDLILQKNDLLKLIGK